MEIERKRQQEEIKRLLEEKQKIKKDVELRQPASDNFTLKHPNISPLEMLTINKGTI